MAGDVIMESVLYQTLIDVMVLEIAVIAVTSKIVQVSSLLTLSACVEGYSSQFGLCICLSEMPSALPKAIHKTYLCSCGSYMKLYFFSPFKFMCAHCMGFENIRQSF